MLTRQFLKMYTFQNVDNMTKDFKSINYLYLIYFYDSWLKIKSF